MKNRMFNATAAIICSVIVLLLPFIFSVSAADYGDESWEAGYELCYDCNWICDKASKTTDPFSDWSTLDGYSIRWDTPRILGTDQTCRNCWWYGGKHWLMHARTFVYTNETYDKLIKLQHDDNILFQVFYCGLKRIADDCVLIDSYCNNEIRTDATKIHLEKGWNLVYIGYIQKGGYLNLRYNYNYGTIFSNDPMILGMHHDARTAELG